MRVVYPSKDRDTLAFATKAAQDFFDHPHHFTYANGDPTPGELFAIRWSPYTVLVLEIAAEPLLYEVGNLGIRGDLPKLAPTW